MHKGFLAVILAFLFLPLHVPISEARVTCKNFRTQEEAQRYFEQTRDRNLDGDGDGIACERLPRSGSQTTTTPTQLPTRIPTTRAVPTVVSTGDGDTLRVRIERGEVVTVRLACIDAPERSQVPWGPQASAWLKQKLPAGQAVGMRIVDKDQYGRVVAELFLGNQSVNLMAVQEGMAVVYPQFLNGCSATKQQYLQAEAQAKRQQLGFWNQSNPEMPWEYRRRSRGDR